MGMPQKPNFSLICQTSATVLVGARQIGSVMKPFSNLEEHSNQYTLESYTETEEGKGD